jgi:hypothetical protein
MKEKTNVPVRNEWMEVRGTHCICNILDRILARHTERNRDKEV